MSEYKPKKKIMRKFKMNEISAVDKPAQEGALAVIMKRAIKAVLTAPDDSGHSHIVYLENNIDTTSYNNDEGGIGHSHPYVVNPDGSIRIAESDGHTHEIDSDELAVMLHTIAMAEIHESSEYPDMYKSLVKYSAEERKKYAQNGEAMENGTFPIVEKSDVEKALKAFEKTNKDNEIAQHIALRASALGMTKAQLNKTVLKSFLKSAAPNKDVVNTEEKAMADSKNAADNGAEAKIEALTKSLAKAEAFGKLTDIEKSFYADLDEKAKEAFLAKSDGERKADIEVSKSANPIIYTADDGTEFRKNDGALLIKMAKENDENRRELAKAREEKENAAFEKRAETELQYMPGDVKTRAAIIKSVEGIKDEAIRKAALDTLKAHNVEMSKAFSERGTSVTSDNAGDANKQLDEMAKAHAKEKSVSYYEAYAIVKSQNPELYKRALNGG
jgi:hypothetical protein